MTLPHQQNKVLPEEEISTAPSSLSSETPLGMIQRRRSSVQQDIHDILHALQMEGGWSKATIASFTVIFLLAAVVCGGLSSFARSSTSYLHWAGLVISLFWPALGSLQNFAAQRAMVMAATDRGITLPGRLPQAKEAPVQSLFKETYGPFPTMTKTVLYVFVITFVNVFGMYFCIADKQLSVEYECGEKSYDKMNFETKTITNRVISDITTLIAYYVSAYSWERYLHTHVGIPQDSSPWVRRFFYAMGILGSWFFETIGLLPTWVTWGIAFLTIPVMTFINFVIDSSARRKKMGLPPVTHNSFYVSLSVSYVWIMLLLINNASKAALETSGPAAASIVVNVMSIMLTFVFESMTTKAVTMGKNGPFMFPFYFGIDLLNVNILLSVEIFSAEFFFLVLAQEAMGLCRNCGIYDIVMWASMKLFGIGNESFPLKSVAFLDELNTIAAVDSVSEMMATLGLLCLTIGEASASSLNGVEACGAIVICDADGVPTKSLGGAAAICLAAFVFRAGFFVLERSAFRKIMKNASNIESNALSMAKTVGTLKKATKKAKEAPQEGVQSTSMSAHLLDQVSKSDIKDHANVDVTALINDVVVMMESDNWKHWYFIKESRVSVQRYMKFRGDTSEAHSIYMKLKGSFLSRSTMVLKTSVAELLKYHLDYLNPAKIPEGGSREILEGEGTSRRILHYKVPTPWPLKPLDSVFLELVHEYEIDGRRVALVCCGPCTHPSKPKEKGVVRLDSILFADFYEELEDGSSRWTVLQAFNPKLPFWIRWLTKGEAIKFTTESISLYTRKWERDTRSDKLVQELEDKNAEKLNIANTLSNIFTGSKLFLSLASMFIIWYISASNMMQWKRGYWEEYWIASGLCNSTSSD